MDAQIITTPAGERFAFIPEAEYRALVEAAEDNADRAAVAEFRRKLAAGEEELIPDAVVDRLLSGDSRIKVWRQHRGLTMADLAARAGISQPSLSNIETGQRQASLETLRGLAEALSVTLDDLAG